MALEGKIAAREELFKSYQTRFQAVGGADPPSVSPLVQSFLSRPLNNAILLARMRYFHRLTDFQNLLDRHQGDLRGAVADLKTRVNSVEDPFELLPEGSPM